MGYIIFSTFTIQSIMYYMLIVQETKVQAITIEGTLGDCQLLNLDDHGKPAVNIHEVVWKKGMTFMGKMKGQSASACKTYSERCHVLNNGSLRLCPTLKGDGGQYTADVFNEHRKHLFSQTVQLELTGIVPVLQEDNVQNITIKGTLGDCQLLNLDDSGKPAVSIHEVVWKKGMTFMGKMKGQSASACKTYSERCHVLNNGSLRLCPTLEGDGGQYTADVFNEHRKHLFSQTVQLELTEANKNYPHLLFLILMGVHAAIFLVLLGSSAYYYGKQKNKPEKKGPVLQKQQSVETIEEGQMQLFMQQKETAAAAASHNIECPAFLDISTFKGGEISFL